MRILNILASKNHRMAELFGSDGIKATVHKISDLFDIVINSHCLGIDGAGGLEISQRNVFVDDIDILNNLSKLLRAANLGVSQCSNPSGNSRRKLDAMP